MEKRVLSILAILLLLFGSVGLASADDLESLFVEFPFKIKAPYEDDLYMLKFYAITKNMLGATGNSVRHYIPVLVSSSG